MVCGVWCVVWCVVWCGVVCDVVCSYQVVSSYLHHISYTLADESSHFYDVLFLEIISCQMRQSDDQIDHISISICSSVEQSHAWLDLT